MGEEMHLIREAACLGQPAGAPESKWFKAVLSLRGLSVPHKCRLYSIGHFLLGICCVPELCFNVLLIYG